MKAVSCVRSFLRVVNEQANFISVIGSFFQAELGTSQLIADEKVSRQEAPTEKINRQPMSSPYPPGRTNPLSDER